MKLLVTGRHGQLARAVAERAGGSAWLTAVLAGRPELDLAQSETVASVVRSVCPDIILNAAAYTAVDRAEAESDEALRINGDGAGEVARQAAELGIPVIQISTDYVFDGRAPLPYAEDAPTSPVTAYGRTKLEGERQVREATSNHLILRTAWVYSPFGRNFVKTMMALAQARPEVGVVSDQIGNPTSALDLADAVVAVLDALRSGRAALGKTYHVAGTGQASWCAFAEEVFRNCANLSLPAARVRPITSDQFAAPAKRPANSVLNSDAFAGAFGFRLPPWRDSLPDIVRRIAEGMTA